MEETYETEQDPLKPDTQGRIDDHAVSIYDPLHRYLTEVRRYPFLTMEEEVELVKRFREKGELDAVTQLILSHLRLAVSIAMEYKHLPFNVMDLIQEGNVGLMHAVKKFDPAKKVRVSTYATWWIRAYILKHILQNWRLVRIGTTETQRKLFFQLSKERERLEKMGMTVGPKLLADRLNVKEKEVIEMTQRLGAPEVSLEQPASSRLHDEEDEKASLGSLLSANQESVEETLARKQLRKLFQSKLQTFCKTLKEREVAILSDRVLSEHPKTLETLAEKHQVSKERIRQIEANILKKLRKYMREEIPDFQDIALD